MTASLGIRVIRSSLADWRSMKKECRHARHRGSFKSAQCVFKSAQEVLDGAEDDFKSVLEVLKSVQGVLKRVRCAGCLE